MVKPTVTVERPGKTVTRVTVANPKGAGFEWWCLLTSDRHHDNALCRQDLEKRHLQQAKERNAGIIDIGDALDGMQGPKDPRADRSQLRGEHAANAYFDKLVDEAAEFYSPYALNWLHMSPGNHESSVLRHYGTNVTDRLADQIRWRSGRKSPVVVGRYAGWIQLHFTWGANHRQSYKINYSHGTGGGGPVTKDTIQANRRLAYVENADFMIGGHVHESWSMVQPREYLDDYGVPRIREVNILRLGTYKMEYEAGEGWAVERGHPPKPLAGYWLRFYQSSDRMKYEVIRADCS